MMNKRRVYKNEDDSMNSPNGDHTGHGTEHKKSRIEEFSENLPSCVIHIRSVPNNASEDEIALLAAPFGRLANMIYARRNNQALIEMEDSTAATQMVAYYKTRPPTLCNRTCIVQFSRHSHLDTRSENSQIERAIENANAMARRMNSSKGGGAYNASSNQINSSGNDVHSVLHVMLDNRSGEPINHLLLYKVFSQYGKILRIIMFTKTRTEHALIECDTPVTALTAKVALDNRALLGGRYPMKIEFSKMSCLEVRTENEKCRDFERSPLTDMEGYAINALSLVTDLVVDMGSSSGRGLGYGCPNSPGSMAHLRSPGPSALEMLSVAANSNDIHVGNGALSNLAAMMRFSGLGGNVPSSEISNAFADLSRIGGVGGMFGSNSSNNNRSSSRENCVLIVSNLNETKADPESLFTLFGVYGDVQRVKIMFNKKDTALIQFSDGNQALTAKDNLNGITLFDKQLKINVSRHNSIQMPREETDVGLTKDFSNSNLHRFKSPMSKNYKNIFPPSPVLHLSNIPPELAEDEISDLFQLRRFDIVNFRFLKDSNAKKKMALVQLPSVEDAVMALIDLHNFELNPTSHLRVSFSQRMTPRH